MRGDDHQEENILVGVHRLSEALVTEVRHACEKARARLVPWNGERQLLQGRRPPSLLVSGLRAGDRRIPEDVLHIATRVAPGLPVLLLAEDPLVRATVSLHNGRVTLLGPPHTAAQITSRIRVLLADRRDYNSADTQRGLLATRSPVETHFYQRPSWWIGTVGCRANAATATRTPLVRHQDGDSVTVLVPGPSAREFDDVVLSDVVQALTNASAPGGTDEALVNLLGPDVGVIHLSRGADDWMIWWPEMAWPLWLFSPLRLPNWTNLGRTVRTLSSRVFRLRAASSDLIAGLTGRLPRDEDVPPLSLPRSSRPHLREPVDPNELELATGLAEGGPALQELVTERLHNHPIAIATVFAEVR